MPGEKLYDLAFKYKETKLWKQICDTALFALKLSNGETGYCSVMGELGEHIALVLYVGQSGLDSYRRFFESEELQNELKAREAMLSQDCLQCSFECKEELIPAELQEARRFAKARGITFRGANAYPQFKRFRPARYPWFLEDAGEEQLLCEALSAALAVAEKLETTKPESLGLHMGQPYNRAVPLLEEKDGTWQLGTIPLPPEQERVYPSPLLEDELLLARLKKKKKTDADWASEVVMFPYPAGADDEEDGGMTPLPKNAPVFPLTLLTVNCGSGMLYKSDLAEDYERDAGKLVESLARTVQENGVPTVIQVRDKRTESLLRGFSGQTGIPLLFNTDLPLLNEVEEDLLDHFDAQGSGEEEAGDLMDMIMSLDDDALRSVPPDLRSQLLELEAQGVLPPPFAARLRNLFK